MPDTDPVATAISALTSSGTCLLPAADVLASLGVSEGEWVRFAEYWDDLAPDRYAVELGIHRLRRYGHYALTAGVAAPIPVTAFVQPENSNPLYLERDRHFEPLADAFAGEPLLQRILMLLGRVACVLDDVAEWTVKVHPFRVKASAGGEGQPTPEGLHRDGVTLVTSLLINRSNAAGGQSTVFDMSGRQLLAATLAEPGTLLLGDDRRTVHCVSPIRPVDESAPAMRDVLVVTFA